MDQQQSPTLPSSEHRFGLFRISSKQSWIGLTEREFRLMYEVAASSRKEDWLFWQAPWKEWKLLAEFDGKFEYQFPDVPTDVPKPPKLEKGKTL